ncbi:Mu transposase C-terminal domain-containing protein, partial [Pasteurella multocida]
VWERDYRPSNVRQASPEQLRLLFLQAETISIKRNGEFKLKAAGKLYGLTNTYWAETLIGITDKKVVARFDPDNLHGNVYVYDIEGSFLAVAECRDAKGFGDTSAAREQGRLYKQIVTSAKKQAESLELLQAHELASLQPQVEVPEPIEERVKTKLIDTVIQDRNALRVVQEEIEVEEVNELEQGWFEQGWEKGLTLMKKAKGL